MSQTSYIAGGLFLGFLVFITIRGELPKYRDAILGGSGSAAAASSGGTQPTGIEGTGFTTPQGVTIPPLVAPVITGGN